MIKSQSCLPYEIFCTIVCNSITINNIMSNVAHTHRVVEKFTYDIFCLLADLAIVIPRRRGSINPLGLYKAVTHLLTSLSPLMRYPLEQVNAYTFGFLTCFPGPVFFFFHADFRIVIMGAAGNLGLKH